MLLTLFHEYGFDTTFPSMSMPHGPFSWKRPIIEEEPGPPFIQTVNGAVVGSTFRASKNQKKILDVVSS
jgi:hypothetical protein